MHNYFFDGCVWCLLLLSPLSLRCTFRCSQTHTQRYISNSLWMFLGTKQAKKRVRFAKKYEDWSPQKWKSELQACGDLKDFTYYPQNLRARFYRLRAPWTYMTQAERKKPAFQRPKKWFPKEEWKKTKKQKVHKSTSTIYYCRLAVYRHHCSFKLFFVLCLMWIPCLCSLCSGLWFHHFQW